MTIEIIYVDDTRLLCFECKLDSKKKFFNLRKWNRKILSYHLESTVCIFNRIFHGNENQLTNESNLIILL